MCRPPGRSSGGAPEITVAVLDSGVLFAPTHPDLENRLAYRNAEKTVIVGWDMIRNPRFARDGNARDKKPKDEGDWETVGWCGKEDGRPVPSEFKPAEWHGSHVAGIIGAVTDNGIGVPASNPSGCSAPVRNDAEAPSRFWRASPMTPESMRVIQ
ncbi:S8 family serine peptidase [Methylococcus capsulatus]|uniref:Peptidase S8/S53 domain-containing protein n=1 Tax=Methylococcus capsulatus TaxID=414 RepID=A0AA35Y0U2_METCP|nr:protein of unknown function [Methylococcus capsulatus]